MEYLHILLRMSGEIWAVERNKLSAMVEFILFRAAGGELSPPEVESRVMTGRREREVAAAPGNVAVLPIHGLIMPRVSQMRVSEAGTPLDALSRSFRELMADDNVKAIVLDIDSPGGVSSGVDEFASEMHEARGVKPVIAQVNSLAASAAYWLAAQADEIVVTPSGRAGSIGVYSIHDDVSGALAARGVKRTIIASHENKVAGNPFGPLTDEARAKIEKSIRYTNDQFVAAVARGRNKSQKHVDENFGQGDVYDPPELLKRGMVDRIAPMAETLRRFGVGVSPAKRTQASAARASIARGVIPARSDFEALLREDFRASKSLASALASGVSLQAERSESGLPEPSRSESGGDAGVSDETLTAFKEAAKNLAALAKP